MMETEDLSAGLHRSCAEEVMRLGFTSSPAPRRCPDPLNFEVLNTCLRRCIAVAQVAS